MVREYGYEYDAVLSEDLWKQTAGKVTDERLFGAICLRSGRDALKAIAREYEPCTVWLPALSCDSMVHPFEQYGHKVRFYRLHSDYSIDFSSIETNHKRALLLYMGYFGHPASSDRDMETLREDSEFIFIRDLTHDLLYEQRSLFRPEYSIASLRKWIPIPDGALMWGTVTERLGTDTAFSAARLKAQCMRHTYLNCGDEVLKTEFRRIFSTVSDLMEHDGPSAMSAYSYALATNTDWNRIRKVRKDNAGILVSVLHSSPFIKLIQDQPGESDLYVAFTVPNRDEVQRRLSSIGIFNTVIWPLTDEQKTVCGTARFIEENMLAAPCDQRYTTDDMKYIGAEITRIVADVNR